MGQPITQFQILAKDPDRAARFYSALFGWTVDANNALGYRTIKTGSERGINGGIWPVPPEGHSMVSLYVEVDDVAASVESARGLGGTEVIPPQKLPDGDQMAVIVDPEGIPVGLFKPAERR
ncbi:MAG TPA: VOC family protein [Blastocatellia bacterium]|nr:VOC family protein [Blastocatellia bacterium]